MKFTLYREDGDKKLALAELDRETGVLSLNRTFFKAAAGSFAEAVVKAFIDKLKAASRGKE